MNTPRDPRPLPAPLAEDPLLSVADIAKALDLEPKTVADWVRSGALPALKIGRHRRVPESEFRNFLGERARAAAEEAAAKRQELRRREQLRLLQKEEPRQHWGETTCIGGCLTKINVSRYQRLDGRALCDACSSRFRETGLPKEAWDRRIALEVIERSVMSGEHLPTWERDDLVRCGAWPPRTFIAVNCGYCEKPQALAREDLLRSSRLLLCSHDPPFGDGPIEWIDDETPGPNWMWAERPIAARLAHNEVRERQADRDDPYDEWWWVSECTVCHEPAAVVNTHIVLVGGARCKLCTFRAPDPYARARAIQTAVGERGLAAPTLSVEKCLCSDGSWTRRGNFELVDAVNTGRVILSWCKKRSREEKIQLARAFASLVNLPADIEDWLLDDFRGGAEHYIRPLLRRPLGPD